MLYEHMILQDFVSAYHSLIPAKETLDTFSLSLRNYLSKISDSKTSKESQEEFEKNLLRDFLKENFDYECNTKGKIDLSIYEDSIPRVIFELKSSENKAEFVRECAKENQADNATLESKAFYESILYYLRESITHKNNNLTHIILSNSRDFYLIDANEYLTFAKNKAILKAFKNCENKEGNDTSTAKFYDELAKILSSLDSTLHYTHFKIDEIAFSSLDTESLQVAKESHKAQLPLIYQILSPFVLLKRKSYIDANTLNQNFYNELLHILGLEEVSQNSKTFIVASSTPNTLLDTLCATFGYDRETDFEEIFALLTTWNNRLLFLRLLESMLLSFKHITKPFLDLSAVPDFPTLNTLFFDILAKLEDKRGAEIPQALSDIPYLNSSLFDKTPLERKGKEIKLLESKPIRLYADSILYKDKNFCARLNLNNKAKDSTLPLLEYLFAFLHAYDFTTTPQDIHNYTKMNFDKLINSAVLGLVFEKLNGYKEGSFYTPSFITSYMCKQSLEKVVLQKFNECKNWDCQSLEELKTRLDKLIDSKEGYKEANAIFDSIKLCDPAVGSGHFLVSALNEMIALKFELRILCDENNERLKDIDLKVINDEIVIRDSANALFAYTLPKHENIETHKIQKALFSAKRKLIESCLFGVDINPNSCEITKLRLWIELLKVSYYKDIPSKRLETLPNIDINIKCGNSLISRFAIDSKISKPLEKQIEVYKKYVKWYKEPQEYAIEIGIEMTNFKNQGKDFKNAKEMLEYKLKDINRSFTYNLKDSKTQESLTKKISEHFRHFGYFPKEKHDWDEILLGLIGTQRPLGIEQSKGDKAFKSFGEIQTLKAKLDYNESGEAYKNAFEWRFAFPEVLDFNGDFLGFDLVIGNPPYIKEPDNKRLFDGTRHLRTYQGKMDIWYHFVGRGFDIVKNQGIVTFIATQNWTTNTGAKNLRNVILKESQILNLVDFGSYMCFDSASIQTMIMEFRKLDSIPKNYQINYARIDSKNPTDEHRDAILGDCHSEPPLEGEESHRDIVYLNPTITPLKLLDRPLTFSDSKQAEVLEKILQNGKIFLREDEVAQGIVYPQENINKKSLEILGENFYLGEGIQKLSHTELQALQLNNDERKLIKPIYETKQIFKYSLKKINDFWVIYTDSTFKKPDSMDNYPNLKKHLDRFREVITSDNKPYGLHRARDKKFFTGSPRIIALRKCVQEPQFSYVDFDCYVSATFYIIRTDRINLKFLTGLFNSKLVAFWLRHKGKMQGNHYQVDKEPLLNIPIPKITKQNQKIVDKIIALVDEILAIKAKDSTTNTSDLESEIDSLVYRLYNLNEEEIKIIETS